MNDDDPSHLKVVHDAYRVRLHTSLEFLEHAFECIAYATARVVSGHAVADLKISVLDAHNALLALRAEVGEQPYPYDLVDETIVLAMRRGTGAALAEMAEEDDD